MSGGCDVGAIRPTPFATLYIYACRWTVFMYSNVFDFVSFMAWLYLGGFLPTGDMPAIKTCVPLVLPSHLFVLGCHRSVLACRVPRMSRFSVPLVLPSHIVVLGCHR